MKDFNYLTTALIGYNRAILTFAPKIANSVAVISLIIYHLQRLGVFVLSKQGTVRLGTTVNMVISQIIRMFQIQYWTQITPLNYEGVVIFLFIVIVIELLVKVLFFTLTALKKPSPILLQKATIHLTLIVDKYYLFLPVLESSFGVFSQAGATTFVFALAIFNLVCVIIFRIFQTLFSFRVDFVNSKLMSREILGELIDIIGFLIMVGTYNLSSNIPVYIGLTVTVLQFICLIATPKFVEQILNQVEAIFQAFCFAFAIDILLQNYVYHNHDFPFLLVAAFVYWGLRGLIRYRTRISLRQFESTQLSTSMMRWLPFIFEEYQRENSLLDVIYPVLAYRSNLANQKSRLDETSIFSEKDFSLEDNPQKQKTLEAFTKFMETVYREYFQSVDIARAEVQPVITSYLFFTKRVAMDHQKALVLLHDFKIKLKRAQVPINLRERVQIFLIEESSQEFTNEGDKSFLDTVKVFSILDKTEELKLGMINFIEKKLEFLDLLKAPCLDLNLMKSKGITITQETQILLKKPMEDPELSYYTKFKDLFKFFVEEVLQDSKMAGFNLKTSRSNRIIKRELKGITASEMIERIQNSSTYQPFILVTDNCTINRGKTVRCSKELAALLKYSTQEVSGLSFDEIVAVINYENSDASQNARKGTKEDSDREILQMILRDRMGDFISVRGVVQYQIFNDVPCMVLFGQEDGSTSEYLILCKEDGQIQGVSRKLASSLEDYDQFKGRFIHQILSEKNSSSLPLAESYKRKSGLLRLNYSKGINEETFIVDFTIYPFRKKDINSQSHYKYAVYLDLENSGFKDNLKTSSLKPISAVKHLANIKSKDEVQQTEMNPFRSQDATGAEKNEKLRLWDFSQDIQGRDKKPSQSILPNRQAAYSYGITSAQEKIDNMSEQSIKSSYHHNQNQKDFSKDSFEGKVDFKQNSLEIREGSTSISSSMHGTAKRQRRIEKARQLIKRHSLPASIRWMRVLQLGACITIFGYLIGDYLDLTRRFEILSQLSGITSFPLTLMTIMAAFLNVSEMALTIFQGLWLPLYQQVLFYLVPYAANDFFTVFNNQYEKYVLQTNPATYYSDFTYESYALNLVLPDSPYLNRVVKFNEALDVLRGYMGDFLYSIMTRFTVNMNSLNFFSRENLNFNSIFSSLSDDLFSRLSNEFNNLLMLLKLRIIVGIAAAVTIAATVLYVFFKLHSSTENLLSKFSKISESELDNEINCLREKIEYLKEQSEEARDKKKPREPSKPIGKKTVRTKTTTSKKYKSLNQPRILHISLSFACFALFFFPFIVGYVLKRSPVNTCIPLLTQYNLLAESGASAAAISAHLMEVISTAGSRNSTGVLTLLNVTSPYIDESNALYSSLYDMLNTIDSLENNPYISNNLTASLQALRNQSFCSEVTDPLIALLCNVFATRTTAVQFGVSAMFKSAIDSISAYRQELENSPTRAMAINITNDPNALIEIFFTTVIHVALDDVIVTYQSNFATIATSAQNTFKDLLAVSMVYYLIVGLLLLAPLVPWARREYTKIKEIYTLLPADVLISNPYIIMALKGH